MAREGEGSATKYRGRKPTFDAEQLQRTHELLALNVAPSVIARDVGIPRATVYRIKEDPAKMAAVLEVWGGA
jgi:putative DNA-invertase from lambdoid prophage Rac